MSEFSYNSPLQEFIKGMIGEKRSLGYQYESSARTLYTFDQFCLKYGCVDAVITKKLIDTWIQKKPNEALATLQNRACVVRQLALYMTRLGTQAYVLPKNTIRKGPRYTPYIFSNKEIAALFKQTDACHQELEELGSEELGSGPESRIYSPPYNNPHRTRVQIKMLTDFSLAILPSSIGSINR